MDVSYHSSTIFGGHGTVALSMTWTIYEIAKRPDVQARMRAEIMELLDRVYARADTECTVLDLDSLHYTNAVIRVMFTYHRFWFSLTHFLGIGMLPLPIYYHKLAQGSCRG
jgi:hypothetical protein